MAKRYPKETKEEVLKKIREGQRVSEVAKAYGINDMTIPHIPRHKHLDKPKMTSWCNGSQESFFGRFKVEFGEFERFDTYAELLEEFYQQLHYSTFERIKPKLRMSRAEFRQTWDIRQAEISAQIHGYPQVMSLPHTPSRPCGAGEQPRSARACDRASF